MVDASSSAGALMDRVYGRQRHVYDLTRKNFLLGRDHLIAALDPPPGGSVLEIGCGTGRNLIAAARLRPDAIYFGLDISSAMLETARANVARAGFAGRIRLARGDASRFEPGPLFARRWPIRNDRGLQVNANRNRHCLLHAVEPPLDQRVTSHRDGEAG